MPSNLHTSSSEHVSRRWGLSYLVRPHHWSKVMVRGLWACRSLGCIVLGVSAVPSAFARDVLTTSPLVVLIAFIPVLVVCVYVGTVLLIRAVKSVVARWRRSRSRRS